MKPINLFLSGLLLVVLALSGCQVPQEVNRQSSLSMPSAFEAKTLDTLNSATLPYGRFFSDPYLIRLVDTALARNQELRMVEQEVLIARNEIRARKGEYLPFVQLGTEAGLEKVGLYTSQGANDATTNIRPGKKVPEYLPNLFAGVSASWEVDIWRRLRHARDAAAHRFLASREGRNFLVTRLVSEIARSYYELLALDNQLRILQKNLDLQQRALVIVKAEKSAARVTELAVRRFEAEVFKNQSHRFEILQQIKVTENRLNFLMGRPPQAVERAGDDILKLEPGLIAAGLPLQLVSNRPDVRQAEQNLHAARLDVKVARARFLPGLSLTSALGLQSFSPAYLVKAPESILLSLGGGLAGPLVNRNAIKAAYQTADARQIQAVAAYEQSLVNGLHEVSTQIAGLQNLGENVAFKNRQVEALNQSIDISLGLFTSARADYMEVLLTQRDALEARFDLVETKREQLNTWVGLYQALGGGWRE